MIAKEDLKGFNFDKLHQKIGELEKYNGVLPILIYNQINIVSHYKYIDDKTIQEYKNRREFYITLSDDDAIEYEETELIEWINNNPQFEDLLK